MKKLLKISLGAMFVVLPLAAKADTTNTQPTKYTGQSPNDVTAVTNPKYALAQQNENFDSTLATAGYVKGAYNATIKGINAVHDEVQGLDTTLDTYAKKEGVVNTIDAAQMKGSVDSTISGVQMSGAEYSNGSVQSGTTNTGGYLSAALTWGDETSTGKGQVPVSAELGNDVKLAATAGGTASIGVTGTLQAGMSVAGYYADANTQSPETFND